jgi:DNA (cytosine-5)-methyltransferase 3A
MKKEFNPVVFSAFDGISCGHVALERAGIIVKSYMASELLKINGKDNPSVLITQHNYPETIQLGDICKIDGRSLRGIVQIALGGSPCQSFSNAGTRDGFDGKSGLFWEFVRLKNEIQPEYFLLENVWMKKEWQRIITNALGVEPIFINSSVISAQNRPRLYWTDIPYTPIEDNGILLSDVILGAITGASKHGKLNPDYGIVPGEKKWKNIGWEFNPNNKSRCLVRSTGHYANIQGKVMKYIPEHCEALQTLNKGYTAIPGVSDAQRMKALGDAWTVDVLVNAFFKNLPWATEMKDALSSFQKYIK